MIPDLLACIVIGFATYGFMRLAVEGCEWGLKRWLDRQERVTEAARTFCDWADGEEARKARLAHRNRETAMDVLPVPEGYFTSAEALELRVAYDHNPADVPCPTCGPGQIRVLAFIEPVDVGPDGIALARDPEGAYASALYCKKCRRAVGIVPGFEKADAA